MLVAQIVQYPTLQNLQSFLFAISDAQGLYENYEDFEPLERSDFYMKRTKK